MEPGLALIYSFLISIQDFKLDVLFEVLERLLHQSEATSAEELIFADPLLRHPLVFQLSELIGHTFLHNLYVLATHSFQLAPSDATSDRLFEYHH